MVSIQQFSLEIFFLFQCYITAPHNVIQYTINYAEHPNLQKYFAINQTSGRLQVELQDNIELDRDHGEYIHSIHINLEDNYLGNGGTAFEYLDYNFLNPYFVVEFWWVCWWLNDRLVFPIIQKYNKEASYHEKN